MREYSLIRCEEYVKLIETHSVLLSIFLCTLWRYFLPSFLFFSFLQHLGTNMKYDKFNNHSSPSTPSISIDSPFDDAPFFILAAREATEDEFTPGRTDKRFLWDTYRHPPRTCSRWNIEWKLNSFVPVVTSRRRWRRRGIRRNKLNLSSILNPLEDSLQNDSGSV